LAQLIGRDLQPDGTATSGIDSSDRHLESVTQQQSPANEQLSDSACASIDPDLLDSADMIVLPRSCNHAANPNPGADLRIWRQASHISLPVHRATSFSSRLPLIRHISTSGLNPETGRCAQDMHSRGADQQCLSRLYYDLRLSRGDDSGVKIRLSSPDSPLVAGIRGAASGTTLAGGRITSRITPIDSNLRGRTISTGWMTVPLRTSWRRPAQAVTSLIPSLTASQPLFT
jgi:hypothetical protein